MVTSALREQMGSVDHRGDHLQPPRRLDDADPATRVARRVKTRAAFGIEIIDLRIKAGRLSQGQRKRRLRPDAHSPSATGGAIPRRGRSAGAWKILGGRQ